MTNKLPKLDTPKNKLRKYSKCDLYTKTYSIKNHRIEPHHKIIKTNNTLIMPLKNIKKHQKHGNITITSNKSKQIFKLVKGNNDRFRLIPLKTTRKKRKHNKSLNEISFTSLKEKSFAREGLDVFERFVNEWSTKSDMNHIFNKMPKWKMQQMNLAKIAYKKF